MACGVSELVSSLSCRLCVQGRIDGRAWTIFCKGHLLRLLLAPFLLSLSSEVFTNVRRLTSSKPRLRVARKELREVHLQGLVKLLLQDYIALQNEEIAGQRQGIHGADLHPQLLASLRNLDRFSLGWDLLFRGKLGGDGLHRGSLPRPVDRAEEGDGGGRGKAPGGDQESFRSTKGGELQTAAAASKTMIKMMRENQDMKGWRRTTDR
uniref:Uncharacterized protein n=1 Tax=Chromera velia CCMP2878 TaxID=1169474 RepID=A0A0K6S9F5_9ALVE|eukprot:Cvel_7042.t2-p1 / transcript=Cvel_7042.t2 / gene=Cvel_7042 / organism=Chromera_velia_CCMP2878 / gene_product=hypothetical protein / transcript_product=hypothetical protein / location=Cvel_scaffold359:70225-73100(-) / protein_length=207 / sequence_SO=supercontig / SO=protein_coding / is_pseudo=false